MTVSSPLIGESNTELNKFAALYPHQIDGVDFLLDRKIVILADDTGLGKTVQIGEILRRTRVRTLVVAPRGLLSHWEKILYEMIPDIEGYFPTTPDDRSACYEYAEGEVVIISYGALLNDWRMINEAGFDMLILDEAHRLVNPKTQRHKIVANKLKATKYRFLLTATPVLNRPRDLFYLLRCAKWSYPTTVCNELGCPSPTPSYLADSFSRVGDRAIKKVLSPFILRRIDTSLKPEMRTFVHNLIMNSEQRELHDVVKSGYLPTEKRTLPHVLARITRLRQISNDPGLIGESISTPKYESIYDLISPEGSDGDSIKTVVFSEFRQFVLRLESFLIERGLNVYRIDGSMNKSQITDSKLGFEIDGDVMICTKAGEEGHDLQTATQIIHADLPYNPSRLEQRNGRIARIGQRADEVDAHYLICRNSIEERIAEIIYNKEKMIEGIIEPITQTVTLKVALDILDLED